ncbi:uncharacterized protein BO66DRAFT_250218 [Aspergillus aculeatinus CBS 121060]|uniref:Uncharacterized protein n=1 Tax=Aspergillus aculeatinus CBS 121060 TaxID=1448322 RepID=A0ACD1HHC6_9EURO|nr:hypothetical protein BO66DRAFT_250218 [Aspergillus aculeatinus CBS 121060]RAH72906.1 hypothetical protein BO66DRAFT_250218 [Aspergillus aculeatinus CBS 121060]
MAGYTLAAIPTVHILWASCSWRSVFAGVLLMRDSISPLRSFSDLQGRRLSFLLTQPVLALKVPSVQRGSPLELALSPVWVCVYLLRPCLEPCLIRATI